MLDEELTRQFEDEMEKVRGQHMKPEQVLSEAREKLTLILEQVKKDEKQIGEELKSAFYKTREEMSFIGKCPKCGKNLEVRKGKFGRFIACSGYPECKNTFNLPNTGIIKATEQVCEHCGNPMISIRRKKSKPQVVCIYNECPSKKNGSSEKNGAKNGEKVDKLCPKCQSPLVLRKSIYGEFYGCSKFPKCRYTEKIKDNSQAKKAEEEKAGKGKAEETKP
jgi:DNA topoisomerase-1